jgi:hypothetical protein
LEEPSLREQFLQAARNAVNGNTYETMKDLSSKLMGNSSFDSLDSLNIKEKMLKIPKLDIEKFKTVQNEIIEYIKEKLKNLLDFHSIRFNDLSWVK